MEPEKTDNIKNKKQEKKYKTDGGKTKSNAIEIPSISLPKGGGAIKGIDQKFSVNAVNGTATMSIPLPVSPARGASPALNLSYNSGSGNDIFGLGWSLNLPSIKRKTDKKLPQYQDYIDSDTYLLSEAEDLVPEYKRNSDGSFQMSGSNFIPNETTSYESGWTVRFYKPRIEGLFARIERWTKDATGEIKWRVISKDNMITLYGWNNDGRSRIVDPANTNHIYEWLPEIVIDDKGNCALYKYKAEDNQGLNLTLPHNRNRYNGSSITYTNRYIDKILYGNKTPYSYSFTSAGPSDSDFMFQTVFDYGQYDTGAPHGASGNWNFREDPFSEYKAGFEIRTTRLCKRVLLFHYFTGAFPDNFAVVKSLEFNYDDNDSEGFTFLMSVTSKGHIKLTTNTESVKSFPATEFTYQKLIPNKETKEISRENLINAPTGISQPYQFTDLYNEGLSGILSEQAGAWYYKRNNGNGEFEAAHRVSPKPSFTGLGGSLQLLDLDGDGVKQIVNYSGSPQGFFELSDNPATLLGEDAGTSKGIEDKFQPFRSFKKLPNINLNDPNARLIDLNGDGKAEVLITEDSVLRWYESDGREGFKDSYTSPKFNDEEEGPKLVFADKTQSIFLADMSGDGLIDIVRIRNGEVCYWPNLGYGRFGKRVSMDWGGSNNAFDSDADFNPAYIKLADIDGSGTSDIIYLGKNKFTCRFNHSGNALSDTPLEITGFPSVHGNADISVTDLLGNGLSCIVWSSALQKDAQAPLRYIDLMDSTKPHLMKTCKNNMGGEVELEYTPSTKYYINDKKNGAPWVTRLHFPVYCLSKVINRDKVTGHVFTSNYTYHHGYYDHAEQEFRGFGRIDQTDTETSEHWTSANGTNLTDAKVNQAPVLTRSWFHTGAPLRMSNDTISFLGRDKTGILDLYEHEYWYNLYNNAYPTYTTIETKLPEARIVPDNLHANNAIYATGISGSEKREAYRACKSMPLRTEVFTLEGTTQEQLKPTLVSTHNCMIEVLQPRGTNKHAVFCVKESEAITYSYDRNISDPRIAHTLNLEMDIYGNVLKSVSVVYPRLVVPSGTNDLPALTDAAQAKMAIVYTENSFTNDATGTHYYRLRLPLETKAYEITGLTKAGSIYVLAEFNNLLTGASQVAYEASSTTGKQYRLIEHVFSRYYKNDLTGVLPGTAGLWLESLGLPYENYQLAYTANGSPSNLINDIFNEVGITRVTSTEMGAGEFEQINSDWWIRSGVATYIDIGASETASNAQARFYVPISYTDPYGSVTTVSYDANFLFIDQVTDAVGNVSSVVTFDYRNMAPVKMEDVNDNLSEVILDELGLPKVMAVYGKGSQADSLTGHTANTPTGTGSEQETIDDYFNFASDDITDSNGLHSKANTLLNQATARFVYDLHRYVSSNGADPVVVSSIFREEHYANTTSSPLQVSFEYSSGLGQVILKKVQAEPGMAKRVTVTGPTTIMIEDVNTADGSSDLAVPSLRWITNGRTVFNNKGNPVKQYEPFFSVTCKYESHKELVNNGVTAVLKYDAQGRVIRTDFPDKSFTTTVYDSWKQTVYDQNDNCSTASAWYLDMYNVGYGTPERDAAVKAAAHYNTPKTVHFDTLGRPVLEQEMLEKEIPGAPPTPAVIYNTHLILDIEGNLREVIDARTNSVMKFKYSMLGQMVYQESMDSGKRWLLHDCMGSPLRTWDQRDHQIEFNYDILHRPLNVKLHKINSSGTILSTNIVDRYIYGEGQASDATNNLRGKLYRHYDTGGLEEMAAYDFKDNVLSTERWLASDYKNEVDWVAIENAITANTSSGVVNWSAVWSTSGINNDLESTSFTIATNFDALNRIKEQTAPDGSIITPTYSERGALISEDVDQGSGDIRHLKEVLYDAKGQRTYVKYGNGTSGNGVYTEFTYDEKTFRLKRLLTKKPASPSHQVLQDLNYIYDAVGNITWKNDAAIPDTFYNNDIVSADNEYTYDALYRLTEATGRESHDMISFGTKDNWHDNAFKHSLTPGNNVNQHTYTQYYSYDEVGNITELQHSVPPPDAAYGYTRTYTYNSTNNRLTKTTISGTDYNYSYHAQHGFITSMPHLDLDWNFKDEVKSTTAQYTVSTPAEITYYQYDSTGNRLRKITETSSTPSSGTQKHQRIYIEGYEYYKDFGTNHVTETLSLIDGGQRFVMIENSTDPGITSPLTRYIHPNHQGSCTLETDDDGDVITYEEYHPFGTTSYQATNASITASAKRYRYTGMERDDETGLNYHNARYYIPWLGRWLNPDPIGIGDGVNVYGYCLNNPVGHTDRKGTQTTGTSWSWKGVLTVAAVVVVATVVTVATAGVGTAVLASAFAAGGASAVGAGVAVGAVAGAVGSAAGSIVGQKITNPKGNINWKQVGKDAAIGAALGGVTGGAGAFLTNTASGAKVAVATINAAQKVAAGVSKAVPAVVKQAAKATANNPAVKQAIQGGKAAANAANKGLEKVYNAGQAAGNKIVGAAGKPAGNPTSAATEKPTDTPEQPAPASESENSTSGISQSGAATGAVTVEYKGIQTSIYRAAKQGTDPKDFFKLKKDEYRITPDSPRGPARGLSIMADADEASQLGTPLRILSIPDELRMIPTASTNFKSHFDIIPKDLTMSEETFQSLLNKIKYEMPHQ